MQVADSHPKCTLSQKAEIIIPWACAADGLKRMSKIIKCNKKEVPVWF